MVKTYSKQAKQPLCFYLFEREKAVTMSDSPLLRFHIYHRQRLQLIAHPSNLTQK